MRFLLILACIGLLAVASFAQSSYPKIWTLTGGNPKGIGHGYNIRSQRFSPEPLLNYQHWNESLLVNGQRYAIPYEAYGQAFMRIKFTNDSSIFDSFQDFYDRKVKNFGISVGVSIYGVGVTVGYSKLRGDINALTKNFSRAFSMGEYVWHAFDLEVDYPSVSLDDDFMNDIKSLPTTYDAGREKYRKVIDYYGTHVLTKAAYGCRLNYTLAFDRDMMNKQGTTWTARQISVSVGVTMGGFGLQVGFGTGKAVNRSAIDGKFESKSNGVSCLLGGDETLFHAGIDVWYPTCVKNREILLDKSKVVPMAELLRKFDANKYLQMKTALQDYAKNP